MKELENIYYLDGIAGQEDQVRNFIIENIEGKCEFHVDNMGNVIAFKQGKQRAKNKVMLSAHMDEVGFIITNITDDGYLKFDCVGGIDSAVVCGKRVSVGEKGILGVVGVNHVHLLESGEHGKVPKISQMYIDIGADSKEQASEFVEIGDAAYFLHTCQEFGDNKFACKALDDRFGCYVMLELIQNELEYDLHFAFLVQEEVGLRGGAAASYQIQPDYAIVIEATTANDIAYVSEENQVCTLGGGAVVSFMDRATVYNYSLYKKAMKLAKDNNIKAQTKTTIAGGNDAGSIHKSIGGVYTLTVSLPCRYIHSGTCVADKADMKSCEDLVKVLAEDFANA